MNVDTPKGYKLFTFFCLYIAQKIPMSFFSTVIPVIMRQQNFSLETIGLLQLLKLPWILKFLWSPVVDRSTYRLNDFKAWIFSSELIYACIIFSIAFLDLSATPQLIIGLVIVSFIASATQDIATDALAVISFNKKDKSLVNSMQSMGGFAGTMIGSGALLLLYNKVGWGNLLPYLALFVLIAVIPLIFFRMGAKGTIIKPKQQERPTKDDILGFFKQKGIWKQVVFLFLYYAGLIGVLAMLKPMLVDYGYSMKDIGIMSGIVGTFIGCLASFAGGFVVRKIGRHTSRVLFAVFTFVTTIYFCLLINVIPVNIATLHLGISLLWGSYGLSVIVVYTTAMDCVRPGYEGTDFTIQTVITHLSGIIMGVSSGKIAAMITYKGLFVVEMFIALASLLFILFVFKLKAPKEKDETRITE
ncbi:MFS transporter [Dysgonomonas sp. 511]|uniref:MFS transporter n=1 Tax=Dysgonomonas sp. 511 TaxID=2302930 RepID=UPI0013D24E0C|nr:MFS transporter [Dysgonomonas sp. 511]NDV78124.1 MFS transporter [Dysgonomonas sp. 511]